MPNFTRINPNDGCPISEKEWIQNGWKNSAKFNSKNRIVDEEGKTPRIGFTGQRYQIISKIERDFSYLERTKRGFSGALEVVRSLDFSLSKPARELFTKQKEKIRFAVLISSEGFSISEEELQQGISISEETVSKVQTYMENILQEKKGTGIKFHYGQKRHRIFELDSVPGLLFKIDTHNSMKDRYQNMIYAQTVIRIHQLGQLLIPNATLFTVDLEGKKHEIIAERKIEINPNEECFLDYADSLNEAIRQLALFICKTGYSDVEWRNNPILNNSLDGKGNRKIALIDLEEINDPEIGLFGEENTRRGLVGCVNEEQGKMIETIAKENNISVSLFTEASSRRKKKLEEEGMLKKYYAKKGFNRKSY